MLLAGCGPGGYDLLETEVKVYAIINRVIHCTDPGKLAPGTIFLESAGPATV